jgi:hypothetical protein
MKHHEVTTEVKGAGWGLFWWSFAAALHVAALVGVIYFTPLRHWLFKPADSNQTLAAVRGARMRKIVRQLIAAHTRHVRKTVQQQKEILAQLQDVRDARYKRYVEQAGRERQEGAETPAPEPLSVLGPAGPDANVPLHDEDFFGLYEIAQTIERTTCGTYRQLRAAELARVQSLSLAEAGGATNVVVPTRPPIDKQVFYEDIDSPRDPRLKQLKDEILKARLEVEEMLASAQHMLDMAVGFQTADLLGTTVFGSGGVFEGSGAGRWGSDIGPGLSPEEYFPGNTGGDFSEDFAPLWGRKLMDDGRQADWMYIDTWYIIGPFPNPGRQNIDKQFPPESVPGCAVDLDAVYVGKNGMNLTWEFRQSNRLMVVPHRVTNYAIWYAYTEIYADKRQDRWVIFGSDDYSRVWLDGREIFSSGRTPHRWIPDRGWRKVRFHKGVNRMLLKIENAGGTMGFSVAIYLGDVPAATEQQASP